MLNSAMSNTDNRRTNTVKDNDLTVTVAGMEKSQLIYKLKVGAVKDLYAQKLITKAQMERALEMLKRKGI